MKRVGNLYSELSDYDLLLEAHKRASKNKNHYEEVIKVNKNTDFYIQEIQRVLRSKSYEVKSTDYICRDIVDKGKERTLYILPYYPHRIIRWALILVMKDTLNRVFISTSYASIKGKGQLKASLDLREALKNKVNTHYLQLDIKKFYPNINRSILKEMLRKKFKDKDLLNVLDMIIDTSPGDKGIPLGSLLSQWLGNFYLTYLDHYIKEDLRVNHYFRYCDDLLILGESRKDLNEVRDLITRYLSDNLNLTVKDTYRLRNIHEGIDFVGYVHYRNKTMLRRRNKYSLRRISHKLKNKHKSGKLLTDTDRSRISSYIGWVKYCDCIGLRKTYIDPILKILDSQDSKV